jgi:hypothetical protein
MKIVMTLLVRDEEDILRANLDFHLAQGVDFVIIMDNLSEDSTRNIAEQFARRGLARYLFQPRDDYSQAEWVTSMARMAFTEHGADWVINNDADEFWLPHSGDLRSTFAALDPDVNTVVAERHNFVPTTMDPALPFHRRMVYRQAVSLNSLGRRLPAKVAHRGSAEVTVAQGNHAVTGIAPGQACANAVEILHFPLRTRAQLVNKITKGGAAYARNTALPAAIGITWRKLYERAESDLGLGEYFAGELHDEGRLAAALAAGSLTEDLRLQRYLDALADVTHCDRAEPSREH